MDMSDVMRQKEFVIVGDTLNEEKYACKIKNAMLENGYGVSCVGKELASIRAEDTLTSPQDNMFAARSAWKATFIFAFIRVAPFSVASI